MNSAEYLDLAMEKANAKNDNQLAQALKWSRARVSNYRNLKTAMDNDTALEIAELTGIAPIKIIADMEIQKGKSINKKAWDKLSKQAGKISANLLIVMPFLSFIGTMIVYYVKSYIEHEYRYAV